MGAFEGRGLVIQGLRFIAPKEALELFREGVVLVDLRSDELSEVKTFGAPEQVHLPQQELPSRADQLPPDRPLLLADSAGVYTKAAAHLLLDRGFAQVACLNGGMLAWDQAGLPVGTDPSAILHGECACVLHARKGPT